MSTPVIVALTDEFLTTAAARLLDLGVTAAELRDALMHAAVTTGQPVPQPDLFELEP